jgi:amidophosphoribosyltransferase
LGPFLEKEPYMSKYVLSTANDAPEKPRESCGIFGICGHPEAAAVTYFGLYALQHRGQESAGIAVARNESIFAHRGMGLVPDVFDVNHLEELEGCCGIGHVRYSTTGSSILTNAQPFIVRHRKKAYAVGHNGNITNAHILKEDLEQAGSIFQSTMDSEIMLHLFVKNLKHGFEEALVRSVKRLEGAFSFVMLTSRGEVIGIRDPHGFRPLCLGALNGSHVLASESCALDLVEAQFVREIEPGEIVIITTDGIRSIRAPASRRRAFCIFEFIYFARPDSTIDGRNVYLIRKAFGRRLAREAPVEADFVMPFPDSGTYAAVGYSEESGIPYEIGMIRNHYYHRRLHHPRHHREDPRQGSPGTGGQAGAHAHLRPAPPVPLPLRHRFFHAGRVDCRRANRGRALPASRPRHAALPEHRWAAGGDRRPRCGEPLLQSLLRRLLPCPF